MTSYIIISLFVYGIERIINSISDFFEIDLDWHYKYRLKGELFETHAVDQYKFVQFLMKPTMYCNVCMSSFWGTIAYLFYFDTYSFQQWVFHCVVSAAIISIINYKT